MKKDTKLIGGRIKQMVRQSSVLENSLLVNHSSRSSSSRRRNADATQESIPTWLFTVSFHSRRIARIANHYTARHYISSETCVTVSLTLLFLVHFFLSSSLISFLFYFVLFSSSFSSSFSFSSSSSSSSSVYAPKFPFSRRVCM